MKAASSAQFRDDRLEGGIAGCIREQDVVAHENGAIREMRQGSGEQRGIDAFAAHACNRVIAGQLGIDDEKLDRATRSGGEVIFARSHDDLESGLQPSSRNVAARDAAHVGVRIDEHRSPAGRAQSVPGETRPIAIVRAEKSRAPRMQAVHDRSHSRPSSG